MTSPLAGTAADSNPGDIRVRVRETVRTGRYAVIGADPADARRIWFALHGYGQLAPRFLRPFEGIVPPDTCVVAPEGLSRFYMDMPRVDGGHLQRVGATWMTREARELDIADTMRWLDVVHDEVMASSSARGSLASCGILAFSQGVATAMRWVAHGTVRPATFVAWAGGLAHDVNKERFAEQMSEATVVLVAGDRDGFATAEARTAILQGFKEYKPSAREILFPGEHHLDPGVLAMLMDGLPQNL